MVIKGMYPGTFDSKDLEGRNDKLSDMFRDKLAAAAASYQKAKEAGDALSQGKHHARSVASN